MFTDSTDSSDMLQHASPRGVLVPNDPKRRACICGNQRETVLVPLYSFDCSRSVGRMVRDHRGALSDGMIAHSKKRLTPSSMRPALRIRELKIQDASDTTCMGETSNPILQFVQLSSRRNHHDFDCHCSLGNVPEVSSQRENLDREMGRSGRRPRDDEAGQNIGWPYASDLNSRLGYYAHDLQSGEQRDLVLLVSASRPMEQPATNRFVRACGRGGERSFPRTFSRSL